MLRRQAIVELFADQFGYQTDIAVHAPGRVNIIGDHTDYNNGFVFPAAINFGIDIAGARRSDEHIRVYSANMQQCVEFNLSAIEKDNVAPWSDYIRGVIVELQRAGFHIAGCDLALYGDIPQGAGLSSSAALEVATVAIFAKLFNLSISPEQAALIGQRAENQFVRCGLWR